jgi:hypothetical protein
MSGLVLPDHVEKQVVRCGCGKVAVEREPILGAPVCEEHALACAQLIAKGLERAT